MIRYLRVDAELDIPDDEDAAIVAGLLIARIHGVLAPYVRSADGRHLSLELIDPDRRDEP